MDTSCFGQFSSLHYCIFLLLFFPSMLSITASASPHRSTHRTHGTEYDHHANRVFPCAPTEGHQPAINTNENVCSMETAAIMSPPFSPHTSPGSIPFL